MSFFRDYLQRHEQKLEYEFDELDENWFVFSLLLLRLGLRRHHWMSWLQEFRPPFFPSNFLSRVRDPLKELAPSPELQQALRFVSTFLCFFVPKPSRYRREIRSFTGYFIPGFVEVGRKRALLFESALPTFSTTLLQEAKWETVSDYFRPISEESDWASPKR